MKTILAFLRSLFTRGPQVEYRTIDGNRLAPYPGMTDYELDDFEKWADSL